MSHATRGANVRPDPGHVNCVNCQGMNLPECSTCHRCRTCCRCVNCEDCLLRHPISACPKCGHCKRSSQCTCSTRNGETPNLERYFRKGINLSRLALVPPRATTVELELCDYNADATKLWKWRKTAAHMDRDGTIRGPHPVELILGPIAGGDLPDVIEEWAAWSAIAHPRVNTTCGMHVHVDARRLDNFGMRRLLMLYKLLEPTFYQLVATDRAQNKNCSFVSPDQWHWYDQAWNVTTSGAIKQYLLFGTYPTAHTEAEIRANPGECARILLNPRNRMAAHRGNNGVVATRYRGLNIHSWFYRGTIEFRMHEGCIDPARIKNWMEWCRWFVELAQRLKDVEVLAIRTSTDFINGVWQRKYGQLQLPQFLHQYLHGGRAARLPAPEDVMDEPLRAEVAAAAARFRATQRAMAVQFRPPQQFVIG